MRMKPMRLPPGLELRALLRCESAEPLAPLLRSLDHLPATMHLDCRRRQMLRRRERPRARSLNCSTVCGDLVPLPGGAARLTLPVAARPVALVQRRLALLVAE